MNRALVTLAAAMIVLASSASTSAQIPRGVSSLSELLHLKLSFAGAPLTAAGFTNGALAAATEQAELEGSELLASEHVAGMAKAVADSTHARFYVWRTVGSNSDAVRLQRRYGFDREYLETLNPGVDFERLTEDVRVLIYRFDPKNPPQSIGRSNRGRLANGMPMLAGAHWRVRFNNESWGTPEAVSNLVRGLNHVAETLPGVRPVAIGDLSYRTGGRMPPHKSHRSGRDADLTYYTTADQGDRVDFWNAKYSPNFDAERQWELFRYWIDQDVVSYLFVDYEIQKRMYWHALSSGEDKEYLDDIFQYPSWSGGRAIIRHVAGHGDHFHVRFTCADADERCR